jgi:FMN-dependent NADH-azoreductase
MSTLLHLDSSGKGPMSVTRPLTQYYADRWQSWQAIAAANGLTLCHHAGQLQHLGARR